jgi:4'-phosphopantetheinyl transferase
MDVQWLEEVEADVPETDDWLSPGEALRLAGMRFPKRRTDWRLGRWTAKCLVAACLEGPRDFADIEIRAASSGAPEVFCLGHPAGLAISLSHRSGVACCAAGRPGAALGCDLELIEPRSAAFAADYFTANEQVLIAQTPAADQPHLLALLWSAKESALKALRIGLRADTRSVAVEADLGRFRCGIWQPLVMSHPNGKFHGWWQSDGVLVRTLVVDDQVRVHTRATFGRGSPRPAR